MRLLQKAILMLPLMILQVSVSAQTTKVKGRVTDAMTGDGVPFAGVYFKGSTVGVSSDMDGYYYLETNADSLSLLTAQMLGYLQDEKSVTPGHFNAVDFVLKPQTSSLDAATVKPDDSHVKWLLRQIRDHKGLNDPEKRSSYGCQTYSKLELDLIDAERHFNTGIFADSFGFVFDCMDTSAVNGKPYLPAMISETIARRWHRRSPALDREEILASRVSGIKDTPTVSQFTGSMHASVNLYDNTLDIFKVQIPSPLSDNGSLFYKYYLIDSLSVDGRKTYKLRFHPGNAVSSPVFDGEVSIDAEEFALRDAHIRLRKTSYVDWIKDIVIDVENVRGEDGWFYKDDRLFVEFSPNDRDSTKVLTFFATRQTHWEEPEIGCTVPASVENGGTDVLTGGNRINNDPQWWQEARPVPLSAKEQGIYDMVDHVQQVPLYTGIYSALSSLVRGYVSMGKIELGPWYKLFSFNNLEGARFMLGLRTSPEMSTRVRFGGTVAYGTRDRDFKWSGSFEYMFGNDPTRKFELLAKKDIVQMGKSSTALSDGSIFNSLTSRGGGGKLSPVREFSARYTHEWRPGINTSLSLESRRVFGNSLVPLVTPDGSVLDHVGADLVRLTTRLSKDEIVVRGNFSRTFLQTDWPIVTLDLSYAPGFGTTFGFFRSELGVTWKLNMTAVGSSTFRLNAGTVTGRVPYTMLKIFEGNGSYYYDAGAFSCMNWYEFAADSWAMLFWRHDFRGFFLGKIPAMRRLGWRECLSLKAAYGTIRDENMPGEAPVLFPEGMGTLGTPYVEAGFGITNIFNLLRVDVFHRLTHTGSGRDMAFTIGVDASF